MENAGTNSLILCWMNYNEGRKRQERYIPLGSLYSLISITLESGRLREQIKYLNKEVWQADKLTKLK